MRIDVTDQIARRVASRFLTAGGSDFYEFGRGSDPKKVFRYLVNEAQREYGSRGYTGSIAEKHDFVLRSRTPMTLQEAERFAEKDVNSNQKYGPAFAVPVAETKVLSEKVVTLKVPAKADYHAREVFEQTLRAKYSGKTLEFKYTDPVQKLKDGGVPDIDVGDLSGKRYRIVVAGETYQISEGATKKEALASFKKALLSPRWAHLKVGDKFVLEEVKSLHSLTIAGEASKLALWSVSGKVSVVRQGNVEGYLFYGIASS